MMVSVSVGQLYHSRQAVTLYTVSAACSLCSQPDELGGGGGSWIENGQIFVKEESAGVPAFSTLGNDG